MTRFKDKKGRTLEISLKTWNGENFSPDFSHDFFSTGSLPYDKEDEANIVDDVVYLFDQANDWSSRTGDFADDETPVDEERVVNSRFVITDSKQREIMRSARFTKWETERFLASGQVTVWVREDYEDQRRRFPEDIGRDNVEEVPFTEGENYVIAWNWD